MDSWRSLRLLPRVFANICGEDVHSNCNIGYRVFYKVRNTYSLKKLVGVLLNTSVYSHKKRITKIPAVMIVTLLIL